MKKIVVIGGGGYVGLNLLPVLKKNEYQLLAVTRKNGSILLHHTGVQVKEKEELSIEDKADIVINLAYAQSADAKLSQSQNHEIVKVIRKVTHPKSRIIHLSSLAVFGYIPTAEQPLEAVKPRNDFRYVASKLEMENLLLSNFSENKIDMVRVGHVWGQGSGWTNTMAQALFYQFPVIYCEKTFSNTTAITNLCDYICFLCNTESDQSFHHLAENYTISWEELLRPLAKLMNVQMQSFTTLPYYPATKFDELKHLIKLNPIHTLRLASRSRFFNKEAQTIINFIPPIIKQMSRQKIVPENPLSPLAKWLLSCSVPFIHQVDKRWQTPFCGHEPSATTKIWLEVSGYILN
jgi:dTDP-4-dehydrorhamnose reductase